MRSHSIMNNQTSAVRAPPSSANKITSVNLVGKTIKVCKDRFRKGQEGIVLSVTKGQVMFQKDGGGAPGSIESFKVYDPATGEYGAVIYSRDVAPGNADLGVDGALFPTAPSINIHQAAPQRHYRNPYPAPSVPGSLQVSSNAQQQLQQQRAGPSSASTAPELNIHRATPQGHYTDLRSAPSDVSTRVETSLPTPSQDVSLVAPPEFDAPTAIPKTSDTESTRHAPTDDLDEELAALVEEARDDESESEENGEDPPDDDIGNNSLVNDSPERTTTDNQYGNLLKMTEDEKRLKLAMAKSAKSDRLDSCNNNDANDDEDAEDSDNGSVDLHSEASARALNYYRENSESEESESEDELPRYDVDNTVDEAPHFERDPDHDDWAPDNGQTNSDDGGDLDAQQRPSNVDWQPANQLRFHVAPLQERLSPPATSTVRGQKRPGPFLEHPTPKRCCTDFDDSAFIERRLASERNFVTLNQDPLSIDGDMEDVQAPLLVDGDMEVVQEQPDPQSQDEMILDGDEDQAPLPVDGVMEGIEEPTIAESQDDMILVDEEEVHQAPLPIDGEMEGIKGSVPTPAPVLVPVQTEAMAPEQDVAQEPQAASEDVQSGVSLRASTPLPTLCEDGIPVTSPVFDASCTADEPSSSEVAAPSTAVALEQNVVQTPQAAPEVAETDVSIRVDTSLPAPCQDVILVTPSEFDASTAIPASSEDGMRVKDASNAGGERKIAVCQEVGKDGSALVGTVVLDDDSSSESESKSVCKTDKPFGDEPKGPNTAEEMFAFVDVTDRFQRWQPLQAPPERKPIQRKPFPPKPDCLQMEEKKAWERQRHHARLRHGRLQARKKRDLAEQSWKQADSGCLYTAASLVNLPKYEAESLSAQNLLQKYTSQGKDVVLAHIKHIFRKKMFLQQLRSVTSLLPLASNITDIIAFVAEDSTSDLGAAMLQFREELLKECQCVLREIDSSECFPAEIARVAGVVTRFQEATSAAANAREDILNAEPHMGALQHQYKMHADLEKKHRDLATSFRLRVQDRKEGLWERFGRWVRDEKKTPASLHPEVYAQDAASTANYHADKCAELRRSAFEALKKAAAARDAYGRAMFKFLAGRSTLRPEVYEPVRDAVRDGVCAQLSTIKLKMREMSGAFDFERIQKVLLGYTLDDEIVSYFAVEDEGERPWRVPAWQKKSQRARKR